MTKHRMTQEEKWTIIRERMVIEGPRRSNHLVIVSVEDESDENGEPIVYVLRMRRIEKIDRKNSEQKPK
jgi:hypothetical protein